MYARNADVIGPVLRVLRGLWLKGEKYPGEVFSWLLPREEEVLALFFPALPTRFIVEAIISLTGALDKHSLPYITLRLSRRGARSPGKAAEPLFLGFLPLFCSVAT